jgi:hypothetical protein
VCPNTATSTGPGWHPRPFRRLVADSPHAPGCRTRELEH